MKFLRVRHLILLLPLTAAACASPRDTCIAEATRDLRTVSGLISESEAILKRGYAIEERTSIETIFRPCRDEDGKPGGCWIPVESVKRHPVAVDLTAERRKLAGLKAQKVELERRARAEIAACEALPDS